MSDQAAEAADLCTRCGLCCDGTVFENAKAYPEDLPGLARHGLALDTASERPAFVLPCAKLAEATCTIYAERFVTCRRFRCKLLQSVEAGETTVAEGLTKIATARSLIAAVEPAARMARHRRALAVQTAGWKAVADPVERATTARRYLAIVALERHLDAHFRKDRAPVQEAGPNPRSAGPKACGSSSDMA